MIEGIANYTRSAIYNESYILLAGQKHPHLMVKKPPLSVPFRPANVDLGPKLQNRLVRDMV
jgi:hypothetical protein